MSQPESPTSDSGRRLGIEDAIAVVAMAALVLITFANVVVRYLTDQSFAWTEEISSFVMFVMTLVAAAAGFARDRHIRIEYFIDRGTDRRRRRLLIASAAAVCAFFIVMTILGGKMAYDEFRFEETSPGIGLPKWWYSIWLPLLSALVAVRAAGLLARLSRSR